MAVARPPIDQTSYDEHQTASAERETASALDGLAQARQQQDAVRAQSDQAASEDFTRDAQQQLSDALAPARRAQEGASFVQEAEEQVRALTRSVPTPGGTADNTTPPSFTGRSQTPATRDQYASSSTGLSRVYQDALASGLDDEGARAAVAVARTEGGMEGSAGDAGVSAGTFQLHHAGGMGNAYAQSQGVSTQESIARLRADPHSANRWALSGYLGQAIKRGQAQGLRGADLATYAQREGQRSVDPERAGANYTALQGQSFDQTADSSPLGAPPSPGAQSVQMQGQRGPVRAEAVGQFEQGLDYATAAAICGPVAALAFVQANGRNPSLAEVTAMAKRVGWTEAGGMNGVANQKRLLDGLGVASRLDTSPDFGEIAADAASGNPVIISTGVHYYYANGYDPATGRLFVGKTGTSRKGGGSWMTPAQIADLDGGINGVLYVDNPQSPQPSVAASSGDTSGERPPSEFEQPPPPGRSVGGSFAPSQAVGGSFAPTDAIARAPAPGPDANILQRGIYAGGQFLLDQAEAGRRGQRLLVDEAGPALDSRDPKRIGAVVEEGANFGMNLGGEPIANAGAAAARSVAPAVEEAATGIGGAVRRFFHGTSRPAARIDPASFDPHGTFGPGFYVTDQPLIAETFARARGGAEEGANIRPVNLGADVNLLSGEDAVPPDLPDRVFRAVLEELGPGGDAEAARRAFQRRLRYTAGEPTVYGTDLWRSTRAALGGDATRTNSLLQRLGFDGVSFEGSQYGMHTPDDNPLRNTSAVVFPESLGKVKNALSGGAEGATGAVRRFLGDQAGEVRLGGAPTVAGKVGINEGGAMPPGSVGRSLEEVAESVTDPRSGRVLRPAAQEVVDAYERLSAERAPVIRDKSVGIAERAVGTPGVRPLLEAAFDAGKRMLATAKTVTTELSPVQVEEILQTGRAPRSMFGAVTDADAAARKAYASVNGFPYSEKVAAKHAAAGTRRPGERITLDEARQFNETVATADRGALGSTEYLGQDQDAVARMYALVTEGEMMPNERQGLVYIQWKPGTERVTTAHHHFGLVDSERDYHAGMHAGLRELIGDTPEGAQEIVLPSGRRLKATSWLVGPSAEDDIRMATLMATMPPEVRARILDGTLTHPDDIAAALLRGQMGKNQPLQAAAREQGLAMTTAAREAAGLPPDLTYNLAQGVNANRTESLIVDPSLHNIEAIRIQGTPEALARRDTVGALTSREAAERLADAVERATGTRPPIIETPFVPGMTKQIDPRLSPGRAGIVDRYTRAGFEDIGQINPALAARLGAGAAAGIDPQTDAEGNLTGVGYDPVRGAAGALALGAGGSPTGRRVIRDVGAAAKERGLVPGLGIEDVSGLLDAQGRPIRPPKGDVAPILDALGQTLKDVKIRAPKVEIPHPEFLQPEAKLAPTTVPLYRQVFDRTRNVIGSMGEGGKELADRVHAWREGAETDAAAYLQRMPTVDKLRGSDFTNMVDVLEGNAKPANPRVAEAAAQAKGVLDDLFSRAENAGVNVAERLGNYFPHHYKEDIVSRLRDTKKRAEAIRYLMDTGQAGDEAEAVDKLSRFATASRDRRHGSLEMERLANLPGYEKTKEALYGHVLSAARRVNEVAQFGRDDAIKDRLVTRMTAEGYEGDLANDMFKTIVGAKTYSQAAEDISRVARTWHTATRLGLSAISNATQSVNTASVAGLLRTLQAMPKAAWSSSEKEFAASTGVTLDSIIKEVREGGGWSDRVPGLLLPGFNAVEKFNRRVAAIAGRDFARDMAEQAARGSSSAGRALVRLGLDPSAVRKAGGVLTPEEEIAAARSIVERTQFRVDPQDLPQWTSHPLGRMASQFKTFSYNQSAFVQRELLDEARKGNILPMVRFFPLAFLAQAAATETRNVLSGREPEEDPGMRALQYALGPLGLVGDVSRTLFGINSKYVPVERRTAQFVGSLAGPTAGTITEGLGAGLNALEGNLTPAARLALRQVPLAGGYLANTLTPYKSQQDAGERSDRPDTSRSDIRRNERKDTRR